MFGLSGDSSAKFSSFGAVRSIEKKGFATLPLMYLVSLLVLLDKNGRPFQRHISHFPNKQLYMFIILKNLY